MDYSKVAPQIRGAIQKALEAYRSGRPVVVRDEHGYLLHGEETLIAIKNGDCGVECSMLAGMPRSIFEAGDAPEILEAARQLWMAGEFPSKK